MPRPSVRRDSNTVTAAVAWVERNTGCRVQGGALLEEALTHRSLGSRNYERLEFLGDAVLSFVVAEMLYREFDGAAEGELSRYRAALVSGETLGSIALDAGLGEHLRLGEGELKSGGFRRASILADALEAVIGAAFVDGGFGPAHTLVQRLFGDVIATTEIDRWSKDAKTELQEWLQARKLPVPDYRIVATRGQAHAQIFEVACAVPALGLTETGEGRSRRSAEQEAARRMLDSLKASDRPGSPLRS